MSAPPKLTKKQKKAVAFRGRTSTRSKGKNGAELGLDAGEVPIMEDQDIADREGGQVEAGKSHIEASEPGSAAGIKNGGTTPRSKAKQGEASTTLVDSKKKRKRSPEAVVVGQHEEEGSRKRKRQEKSVEETVATDKETVKQRFILFVGNLKYTTSLEAIQSHFSACDPPPTVRLLTPKPSTKSPSKPTPKSKGCAFLEFTHRNALQQALKLHQSQLEGRMINVELTAGGGGKSETRLAKVKERNKGLATQRTKRAGEQAIPTVPQRHSATSGLEQPIKTVRTWTVGDRVEDSETHRGGQRHSRKAKGGSSRVWGTGVNAIPVG